MKVETCDFNSMVILAFWTHNGDLKLNFTNERLIWSTKVKKINTSIIIALVDRRIKSVALFISPFI